MVVSTVIVVTGVTYIVQGRKSLFFPHGSPQATKNKLKLTGESEISVSC